MVGVGTARACAPRWLPRGDAGYRKGTVAQQGPLGLQGLPLWKLGGGGEATLFLKP